MQDPLVSIIMATCNHGVFLTASIQSVLEQSYSNWELIIVNDGSTDDTDAIAKDFVARDKRISYHQNEKNLGVPKSVNFALNTMAHGKYIARIDSDDAWIGQDKLKNQIKFLENHPDHVAVGGGMIVVEPGGRELYRYLKPENDKDVRAYALITNPIANSTSVVNTAIMKSIGGVDENYAFNEDWDFWLHIGLMGKIYNFKEYYSYYTFTGANKSMVYLRNNTWTALGIITKYRQRYPMYWKGLIISSIQLMYGTIPFTFRKKMNPSFSKIKKIIAGSTT